MAANNNLPYLEGLSTGELYSLADSFDLGVPPESERKDIIAELLEYAPCLILYRQEMKKRKAVIRIEAPEQESLNRTILELPPLSPLPKQYGFTYIDVLIRDPFWVYVFWEISSSDRKNYEKLHGYSHFLLRVMRKESRGSSSPNIVSILSVKIDARDNSRYLNFQSEAHERVDADVNYTVELCACLNASGANSVGVANNGASGNGAKSGVDMPPIPTTRELILASTPLFVMPRTLPLPGTAGGTVFENPVLTLSGIADMDVYREIDKYEN
jgi:hypothetical protein